MKNTSGNLLPHRQPSHWDRSAGSWHLVGPPLRPSEQDRRIMQQAVAEWIKPSFDHPLTALVLGVTPEIATMRWPDGTEVLAVDRSAEMIRFVWLGDVAGQRKAVRADWLKLPVREASMDVVIGDGSFNCVELDFPEGFRLLADSVRRVVKREGILVMRFYVRPEECEPLEAIFSDLMAGRIETCDGFRLRLMMAVQGRHASVRLDDVWQAWRAAGINIETLMSLTGWRQDAVQSIGRYQGRDTRFTFPTLPQVRATLSEWFEELALRFPEYKLGDRCPMLVFRPL